MTVHLVTSYRRVISKVISRLVTKWTVKAVFGQKVEGFALHLFGRVWRSIGPAWTPNVNDFLLRPKTWLQMARTLVSVAVA